MSRRVTVVDYDCGNLFSVRRALEQTGADVVFAETPDEVAAADRLFLPGVGAFGDAAQELAERGLDDAVKAFIASGRLLLGVCVGMQLLFDWSEEFGRHRGLGIIPGHVAAIPRTDTDGQPHKIPHISWAAITPPEGRNGAWAETPLDGIEAPLFGYFVHSFSGRVDVSEHLVGECFYGGHSVAAVVGRDNVWGCQFHPEKSGPQGLRILERFVTL